MKSEIDCFHSRSKTFGFLEKNYPNSGIALLVVLLGELAGSFNIGKNMGPNQVIDTAKMILNDYPELKIDDIALCFTKAKKGQYGEIYDRLDSAIVFKWINMFLADKQEQIDYYWKYSQREIKEGNQTLLIGPTETPVKNDVAIEYIRKIKKQVVSIQKRNYKVKSISVAKPVSENIIYQIHQQFIYDFRLMYEAEIWEYPERSKGPRFVTCCGRRLDIGEYIQKKHMQLINYYRKVNYYFGIHDPNYERYIAPPMPDFTQNQKTEVASGADYLSNYIESYLL